MKKTILTLVFALISAVTIAQIKLKAPLNKQAAVMKDIVVDSAGLHLDISKQMAIEMLPGLQGAYSGVTRAKNISAEQADDAKLVSGYFLRLIYQKWPDLAPKQPAN